MLDRIRRRAKKVATGPAEEQLWTEVVEAFKVLEGRILRTERQVDAAVRRLDGRISTLEAKVRR